MTTLVLTLDDELAARLHERAENSGVAPEDLAREAVQAQLAQSEAPNLEGITTRVFARRQSAYEKLAEGAP